jgi:hypothetical protein
MKFHILYSFFTFCFIHFAHAFPKVTFEKIYQPFTIRKKPKKVNFDFSEIAPVVTEQTLNDLLISIDKDLLTNPDILSELINGVLRGILSKEVNITGDQCIPTIQAKLTEKLKASHTKFIEKLRKNYNGSDKYEFKRLQQLCVDARKNTRIRLVEKIEAKDRKLGVYVDQYETKLQNPSALYRSLEDIEQAILDIERDIILYDNKIMKYILFDCNKLKDRISFIGELPIGIKSKVILDINDKFVNCYQGKDNDIKELKEKILKNRQIYVKNELVHFGLFTVFNTRFQSLYYGKGLRFDQIEEYFSKAQIAEAKVLKKFGELKRKYPNLKEEIMLRSEEIVTNKKKLAYNMGMAVGIAAWDVLFSEGEKYRVTRSKEDIYKMETYIRRNNIY